MKRSYVACSVECGDTKATYRRTHPEFGWIDGIRCSVPAAPALHTGPFPVDSYKRIPSWWLHRVIMWWIQFREKLHHSTRISFYVMTPSMRYLPTRGCLKKNIQVCITLLFIASTQTSKRQTFVSIALTFVWKNRALVRCCLLFWRLCRGNTRECKAAWDVTCWRHYIYTYVIYLSIYLFPYMYLPFYLYPSINPTINPSIHTLLHISIYFPPLYPCNIHSPIHHFNHSSVYLAIRPTILPLLSLSFHIYDNTGSMYLYIISPLCSELLEQLSFMWPKICVLYGPPDFHYQSSQ